MRWRFGHQDELRQRLGGCLGALAQGGGQGHQRGGGHRGVVVLCFKARRHGRLGSEACRQQRRQGRVHLRELKRLAVLPAGGVTQQHAAFVLYAQPGARMFVEVAHLALRIDVHQAQRQLVERALQRLGVAPGLLQPALRPHEAAHPRCYRAQPGKLLQRELALAEVVVHRQHMHADLGRGLDDAVDHGVDAQGLQVVGIKGAAAQVRRGHQLLTQRSTAGQRLVLLAHQGLAPGVDALDQLGIARQKIVGHAVLVGGQGVVRAGQGAKQHHLVAAQRFAQAVQQALDHAGLAQRFQAFGHQRVQTGDSLLLRALLLTHQWRLLVVSNELRRMVGAISRQRHHSGEGCPRACGAFHEFVHGLRGEAVAGDTARLFCVCY